MDVLFEKIPRLGTDCSRYIPVLSEKTWSPALKELHMRFLNSRKDLAVLKTESYWELFLEFYALTRLLEGLDGSSVVIYQLKPEVSFDFPSKLAIVQAIPESEVRFDTSAIVLTAKPNLGRTLEFILLEGSFTFNTGSVFDPMWATYTL